MASSLLSSIAERLSSLSIVSSTSDNDDSTTASTQLKTYAFKPKGSAEVPKLVLVLAEQSKDIGKASALAKKIGSGIKDMRAAEEDYIKTILGENESKESSKLGYSNRVLQHEIVISSLDLLLTCVLFASHSHLLSLSLYRFLASLHIQSLSVSSIVSFPLFSASTLYLISSPCFSLLLPSSSSRCLTVHVHATLVNIAVSPFSITPENASFILLLLSDSIPTTTTPITISSINTTLSSSSDLTKYLQSTSVAIKELPFLARGSDGAPSVPSSGVPISSSSGTGVIPASKAVTPGTSKIVNSEDALQKPGNLDSLGVTIKKDGDDFGMWYRQVLTYGDMLEYYDVSGCYILKPASYCIWESIQGESHNLHRRALATEERAF